MSFAATFNAFQISGISKGEQHVLAAICTFADKHGICWPTVETIAARCNSSVRTVQTHLNGLTKAGLVQRTMRAGRSALIRVLVPLHIPTPANSAPQPPQISHPEPVTESVNTTTAQAPEPSPPAADAAIVVSEKVIEQPETITVVTEPVTPEKTVDPLAEVPETLLQDLGEVRKAKKKPAKVTRTEAQILAEEAKKAGWPLQQVILTMVLRGWSRFQADWVQHVPPQAAASAPPEIWKPEPHTPASPEALAAIKERIAQMKARWANTAQ